MNNEFVLLELIADGIGKLHRDHLRAEKIMAEIYPRLFKGCNDKTVAAYWSLSTKVAEDLSALIESPLDQPTTTRHTPHRSITDE